MRLQRYMGVDYGEKRIGLALADDDTRLAVPHRVFECSGKIEDDLNYLATYIKSEADIVVVGLPLTREGTEGPMAKKVREFATDLQFKTDLPLHFQDERLTTRENTGLLQGYPTEDKKRLLDALAAASILQTWLDKTKARFPSKTGPKLSLTE